VPSRLGYRFADNLLVVTSTLPLLHSGKVRELYDLGGDLLMVASDRISTYDAVHPTPIPCKGAVLTGVSVFWFERTGHMPQIERPAEFARLVRPLLAQVTA